MVQFCVKYTQWFVLVFKNQPLIFYIFREGKVVVVYFPKKKLLPPLIGPKNSKTTKIYTLTMSLNFQTHQSSHLDYKHKLCRPRHKQVQKKERVEFSYLSKMSDQEISKMEEGGDLKAQKTQKELGFFNSPEVVHTIQKIIAEVIGTYFLIFAGCASVVLNNVGESKGTITFPGICITWGLSVMILVYSLGHISGAHFNPAVTISFAIYRQFPLKQACILITIHHLVYLHCKKGLKYRRIHECFAGADVYYCTNGRIYPCQWNIVPSF